ncbi:hypothetical protein BASA83_000312 [Batrachochytrium salamandrivorans]|nr:hypothetical protein BASA83_000312 [Batrachochytrium salamandrivorans]
MCVTTLVSFTSNSGADLCLQPYAQLDQYFGYWRQPPATYPVVGYPSQWSLQNNGFCSATPQSDFFGNTQAYPYLSDSERRQIALEQGILINIPITSKEDQDTLPKMIRIPISGNEKSDIDVCEDLAESSLIHVNATVDNTVDDTVDELLSSEVANEDPDNLPHIDMCFASETEIEAQSLVEMVEVLEVVGAITAQPHTSVHRLEIWCKRSRKSGAYHEAKMAISTPPLAPKHKSAIRIAPSTSTEQVRIPHAWEAALPATPKKERFHVKPKKSQTHSVTQASGRQNISGDVRNHPDLIYLKKNCHNTNRDGS